MGRIRIKGEENATNWNSIEPVVGLLCSRRNSLHGMKSGHVIDAQFLRDLLQAVVENAIQFRFSGGD